MHRSCGTLRQTNLWRDTKVSRTDSTVHEEKKELEMQCAHEGAVNQPRTKRTAAKVENAGGEDGRPLEKKLKLACKNKLVESIEALQEMKAFVDEVQKTAVQENVHPAMRRKLNMSHAKINETLSGLQFTLERDIDASGIVYAINSNAKEAFRLLMKQLQSSSN